MGKQNNIFLIGPMGAGKSTIGRRLAKVTGKKFLDCDHAIEERTGVSITTIFDIEGEPGFRKRESRQIDELTQQDNIVLATGGGVVLNDRNRERLAERGTVIYLRTSVAQQVERTRADRNRPLLETDDPERKLAELMKVREPLYLDIADIVVDTDHRHSNQVVRDIQKILGSR